MTMIITRSLGITDYSETFAAMKTFTRQRTKETADELWLTQHPAVFTQGQAGKPEHLLQQAEIPVVQSDRGGQITYHGLGQLILYTLIDIKRAGIGIRQMVSLLENCLIAVLSELNIVAEADPEAPGVYVEGKKIASLGLRVRQGCTYHGLALNVDMDLSPFQSINPCGYRGLQMTQVSQLTELFNFRDIEQRLCLHLIDHIEKFSRSHQTHKTHQSYQSRQSHPTPIKEPS